MPKATVMGAVGGYGYSQADKFEDAANDIFVGGVSNGALSAVGPAVSKTYDKSVGKVIDKTRQWYEKSQIDRAYDQVAKNPLKGNMNDVLVRMSPYGKGEYHIQRGAAALGDDGQLVFRGKSLLKEKGTERNFGLNKIIGKHHITKEEAKMIPEAIRNKPSDIRTNEYFDGKNILKNENVGFRTKKGLDEYQLAFGKGSDNPFRLVTMHKKNRDHILTSGLSCQPERYASGGYYPVIEGWSPSGILPQVGQVINANIAHKKNKDHVSARALSPLHDGYASGGFYPNTEGWSPNGILPQVGQVVNANISHKESRGATSFREACDALPKRYASDGYYPITEGWSPSGTLPQAVKEVKPQAASMSVADKAAELARLAGEVRDHLASEELDWNEITAPGREVLMDIHKTSDLKNFPKLMSELREYSYLGAADEISRKGVSGGRNRWAYNKILEEGFAQHDKVYPMSETEKMLNPRRPRTDYLYKDDMIEVPEWLR